MISRFSSNNSCESNRSSNAQQIYYQPFADSVSPELTLDSGTKLTILGYSGGSPSDTAKIYFPFLVINNRIRDTLRVLSALISTNNEENPLSETFSPASAYDMNKGIREAIFEPVPGNQGMLMALTPLASGKVDTSAFMLSEKQKKKPAYIAVNKSLSLLQDPHFKRVIGVLRFKEIPW